MIVLSLTVAGRGEYFDMVLDLEASSSILLTREAAESFETLAIKIPKCMKQVNKVPQVVHWRSSVLAQVSLTS